MFIIVLDANDSDSEFWRASASAQTLAAIRQVTQHDGGVRSFAKNGGDRRVERTTLRHAITGLQEQGTIYEMST